MNKIVTTLFLVLTLVLLGQPCSAQFDTPVSQKNGNIHGQSSIGNASDSGGFNKGRKKTDLTKTNPATKNNNAAENPNSFRLKLGKIPSKIFTDTVQGVTFESTGGVTVGLTIKSLHQFGLAERNGLEVGDVITEVNGHQVDNRNDLANAFGSLPANAVQIEVAVINVRTGLTETMVYELTSEAGIYQTNFGRLEVSQIPTETPGVSILQGTLFFYHGSTAKIQGTLSRSRFRGTSTNSNGERASFDLGFDGKMFEGTVTQGRQHRFILLKAN